MSLKIFNSKFEEMQRLLTILILIFSGSSLLAQQDSLNMVKYTPDYKFRNGLFLNFGQVKNNSPIPSARIVSNKDPGDFNFFRDLVEENTIAYFDEYGSREEVKTSNIWGFAQGGNLFINYNGEFNRIPIIGRVCHFIADVTVYESYYDDPFYYDRYDYYYNPYYYRPYNRMSRSKEMRQYIMRFDTGEVLPYDREAIKVILMEDPELYEEYNNLRKRKQRDLMFFFLRRFNEKHPIYLPVI